MRAALFATRLGLALACSSLLVAAAPIEASSAEVLSAEAAAIARIELGESRRELACWVALSAGAGIIVLLSRRRRRITTD